jgi:hypothetical protein
MPLTFHYAFLLLAAGALLIPGRHRRLAWVGLVPVALGIAALTVRLGGGLSGLALRAAEQGAPSGFLQINSGLILLGTGLLIAAIVLGLTSGPTNPLMWVATVLAGAGAGPMIAAHVPLFGYIGWRVPLLAAVGIGAGALALYSVGKLVGMSRPAAWLNQRLLDKQPLPSAMATTLRALAAAVAGVFLIWRRARSPGSADNWAPLFMPLALLVIWHVAGSRGTSNRRGRLVEMLLAVGFYGVFAGGSGLAGAGWLFAAAVVSPWASPLLHRAAGGLLWLPVAWGGLLVLTGGLGSQVTYTALAAAAIAVAIWVYHPHD